MIGPQVPGRLRRRLLGGYDPHAVDVLLTELRLTIRQLEGELAVSQRRVEELESELRTARAELESHRAREYELTQAMGSAHRRAAEIEEAAESRARALLAEAEEKAARARADASRRTEDVSRQVDELLQLKDGLVQTVRGVIRDFDHAVARIERGESPLASPPPAAPQAAAPAPAPAPPAETVELPASPGELFDARVEIDAGPFADFAAISVFERALGRLPKVEDVYVRRFAGDRALVEVTTSEPAPLVKLMREHLPYAFEVLTSERSRISIAVAASATPAQ